MDQITEDKLKGGAKVVMKGKQHTNNKSEVWMCLVSKLSKEINQHEFISKSYCLFDYNDIFNHLSY